MSVTRLKRKHRKNIARANNKKSIIKDLLRTPVLKNVDLEELKARFAPAGVAGAVAAEKKTAAAPAAAPVDKAEAAAHDVAHGSLIEKAKEAVGHAVDKVKEVAESVAHSDVVEKAKEVVGDAVDSVKEAVSGASEAPHAADNATTFDAADAVTKPVNADGQEGEHPKPEIAL